MEELHKDNLIEKKLNPEGGPQLSLCSNKDLYCGSPSGFYFTEDQIKEHELDRLAEILVEIFLEEKYANTKQK